MKPMNIKVLLLSLLIISLTALCFAQEFAGGSGTREDPWQIETAQHLNNVRNYTGTDHSDKYFIQISNIDLGVAPWNEGRGWIPIGFGGLGPHGSRFEGTFNGNGYLITGLTIDDPDRDQKGLFGVTRNATIENVSLLNVDIHGNDFVGGISGAGSSNVRESYVTGNVRGNDYIGGVVGSTSSSISRCFSKVDVRGRRRVGGIAGNNEGRWISDNYSKGSISGLRNVGGIVGYNDQGTLVNCYSNAQITGDENVGGLIGYCYRGDIDNSYWDIEKSGQEESSGGGERRNTEEMTYPYAENTYVDWNFDERWIDDETHRVNEGYPLLAWFGYPPTGLICLPGNGFIDLIWNEPDEGEWVGFNVYRDYSLVASLGEDIAEYRDNDVENYREYLYYVTAVREDDTETKPLQTVSAFAHEPFAGGNGTEESPFQVETAVQLNNLRYYVGEFHTEKHFVQTANIDLGVAPWNTGEGWIPIGDRLKKFMGSFNGSNFVISGLNIARPEHDYQGLFCSIENSCISNVGLVDIDILAEGYVGGLVAEVRSSLVTNCFTTGVIGHIERSRVSGGLVGTVRDSHIIQCYSSVDLTSVQGTQSMGGLVGFCYTTSIIDSYSTGTVSSNWLPAGGLVGGIMSTNIKRCFSNGAVSGNSNVGGLVGGSNNSSSIIIDSFSTGNVSGENTVGGLVGGNWGQINNSFSTGNVSSEEGYNIGGFAGQNGGSISNSYSTGNVLGEAGYNVGGLAGRIEDSSEIIKCYSIGRVEGERDVGGLIGHNLGGTVSQSYWNRETSDQESSAGGSRRTTEHMTFPHAENTYFDWEFDEIWLADYSGFGNEGYPYLAWQKHPYPHFGTNPYPVDDSVGVTQSLEELNWNYYINDLHTNPAGFRVYFNRTGEFGEDDEFDWIPYIQDQERYSSADILPDSLEYGTGYYWKVIPTTRENGIGEGLDALNCPVWSFVTELNPTPSTADNPYPASDSVGVALGLENLRWEYIIDTTKVNPQGFRVYFNDTGEFGEEDDFEWVPFIESQQIYSNSDILPGQLQRGTIYYWQVIPTTKQDGVGEGNDAANCPLWRFVSEPLLYPAISLNPYPADDSVGVTIDLISLQWDYIEDPRHLNPVGFRVYFDTDDEFGEDDFFWVPYTEEQVEYQCADILPERLDRGTKYYWKVKPTTNEPDERRAESEGRRAKSAEQRAESRERRARGVERRAESLERRVSGRSQIDKTSQLITRNSQLTTRGDAQNVPVWSFTTEGETDIEDSMISCPYVTRLDGNYPNPFNPETTISFSLAEPGNVTIDIFNLKGQKVKTIMNEYIDRGHHKVFWNGRDENNRKVGSGLYFYRMRTEGYTETRRMILLK